MVFPVVMYGCESWIIEKAEHWRTDAFKLWYWKRLLRVPWTARKSNQSILMEINPEYSLAGLMLKLKLHTLAIWCEELTYWKRSLCWERLRAGREVGNRGYDGWTASSTQWTWVWANTGDSEGQGSLARCSPWGCKQLEMTQWLNNKMTVIKKTDNKCWRGCGEIATVTHCWQEYKWCRCFGKQPGSYAVY